ncbi:MAG: fused MFS/spermidine synthase, partial [Sedimentisphaerales bacterium]|nr:fused MFS/spermidine synthase [Sedimentisphaerales bacterium]
MIYDDVVLIPTSQSRNRLYLGITVFLTSCFSMILEIVAGRLTSRYLGNSIYTWTTVIGIFLTGICIGSFLGGRIADRWHTSKTVAAVLLLCSAGCVCLIILNHFTTDWLWLWRRGWSAHVFIHVTLIFLLPAMIFGMVLPVAAKMALATDTFHGRTIGTLYAAAAAGGIAGTFLAGFYLIQTLGTLTTIWILAGFLILFSFFYYPKSLLAWIWALVYISFVCL